MDSKYEKIMIVEDNDLDSYVLETLVKKNNMADEVMGFNNAKDALKYLELNKNSIENLPDIIFLDICMPLMDGYEFLDLFNEINFENHSKCKIFMVSSCLDEVNIAKSKSYSNIVSCITKPVNPEQLFEI
jgi:CheY-like chemotaxis protein